jgi:hypothetical protein
MAADAAPPQPVDPRRLCRFGLALAVLISLAATCYPVFSPAIQAHFADNPDAVPIALGAQRATWSDALGWWHGTWIESGSRYYRPLSSWLFWTEFHLFGFDFQKYCVVSWLLHGANGALLFLFALALFRRPPDRSTVALALLVVLLFNTRRSMDMPAQPEGWLPFPVAWGEMPYWPAQTDLFSFFFSLLSLLTLDRWTREPASRRLAAAVALFLVALLFKEMTIAVALLAPLLVWYRRRQVPWEVLGIYVGVGVVFLLARGWFVPGAWGPKPPVAMSFGLKLLFYPNYDLFLAYGAGMIWPLPTALGILGLVWGLRRYRVSFIWLLPGALIWTLLMCQLLGASFAEFTVPKPLGILALSVLFWGGLAVLLRRPDRLCWTLAAMVAIVHAPIMHVIGPHYLYWPAAFWSLLSVSLLPRAAQWWQELGALPAGPSPPLSG